VDALQSDLQRQIRVVERDLVAAQEDVLMALLIDPELSSVSIVFIGHFNPSIFQPYWFAANELVSEEAARSAQISVIHPDIAAFTIDMHFSLQVTRDRFAIDRAVAPWIVISDLAVRTFGTVLPHTPIGRMGINRLVHFRVKDEATREKIGLLLAPREPWGEFGRRVSGATGTKHGGLQSLTLLQRDVEDRPGGWIQAKIEPSSRIGEGGSGMYMEINDHYEIENWTVPKDAQEIIRILDQQFDRSVAESENIINQIMSLNP
jgi:hypothetical protein